MQPNKRFRQLCPTKMISNDSMSKNYRARRAKPHVLLMANTLESVSSFLSCNAILKMRRVSKFHNKTFYFNFIGYSMKQDEIQRKMASISNSNIKIYKIYFECSNKYVKNIILSQVCSLTNTRSSLKTIALWYFQNVNRALDTFYIRMVSFDDKSAADGNSCNTYDNGNNKHTQLHKKYLFSISMAEGDLPTNHPDKCPLDIRCKIKNDHVVLNNIFKRLYLQLQYLDNQITNNKFDVSYATEYMILGSLYNIKPLKNRLETLITTNKQFLNVIQQKPSQLCQPNQHLSNDYNWFTFGSHLCYLWSNLQYGRDYFGNSNHYYYNITGRGMMMAELCCKGDFSLYLKFLGDCERDAIEDKVLSSGSILSGLFGLFVMFLRIDLIDNYIRYYRITAVLKVWPVLIDLIDPGRLGHYLEDLNKNTMIPIDSEEELFEFDILNNPRYHPNNRILTLWKLCWSTQFAHSLLRAFDGLVHDPTVYSYLKQILLRLYHNFDAFQITWDLNRYSDLARHKEKQYEIHDKFKIIVQSLFCVCEFYIFGSPYNINNEENNNNNNDRINNENNDNSDIYTIEDVIDAHMNNRVVIDGLNTKDVENITMGQNGEFINILPSDESQVDSLFNIMTHNISDEYILISFKQSKFDAIWRSSQLNTLVVK